MPRHSDKAALRAASGGAPGTARLQGNEVVRPESPLDQELEHLELALGHAAAKETNTARLGACAAALPAAPPFGEAALLSARRGHERFPAASTIKVYVLQALMERVAAGELDLADERAVQAGDRVSGSGVLKALSPGRSYTLLDLATLMIVVSDNTATNMLIDALGVGLINEVIGGRGWTNTHLSGKLQVAAARSGRKPSLSTTSPGDLLDYFGRLWLGELLPQELTETCKQIYRQQQLSELGRELDYDPYSVEVGAAPWRVASKSGSLRGVRNDAGVFEPLAGGTPYVVAVMTDGCPDERFHAANLGSKIVGRAAAAIHARLNG